MTCPVCGRAECESFNPASLFFPSVSGNRILPRHHNNLCRYCGVVFMHPTPPQELLLEYYNSAYRDSEYALTLDERTIDLPVQFPQSAHSFRRFRNMYDCVESVRQRHPDARPGPSDTIIDIGGYQGMFLHAAAQTYGAKGIVVDFNARGIEFAKGLGFRESTVISSVLDYRPPRRSRFVSMVHSLEHMPAPVSLLRNVKENILAEGGFIYIEVPNLFASPLSDPTHFFTYSHESLAYLLNTAGFEVLALRHAGNDHAPLTIASDELVVTCLARSVKNAPAPVPSKLGGATGRAVESNYRRLTRKGIWKQFRRVINESVKLLYYLAGHFVLERLPIDLYRFINRTKAATGVRLH